jgi:hypothetical protein
MLCDFTFFDKHGRQIPHETAIKDFARVYEVHIRFRFDKSPVNFSVRKFRRSGQKFLCPVLATLSITLRALVLRVAARDPLGVFQAASSRKSHRSYSYLRSSDVIKVMRQTVDLAYPDPQHYMRLHKTQIDCHSNRVTAAMALKLSGWKDEQIGFRLRWSVQSVKHYIRECAQEIGVITRDVIAGAFRLS